MGLFCFFGTFGKSKFLTPFFALARALRSTLKEGLHHDFSQCYGFRRFLQLPRKASFYQALKGRKPGAMSGTYQRSMKLSLEYMVRIKQLNQQNAAVHQETTGR
jgi:glycosyltransferase involved in cell wall biosynthesis